MSARLVSLLLFVLLAFPVRAQDAEIVRVVEDPPELIGGLEGLQRAVQYPAAAKASGTEGTVFVQFVVDEWGRVAEAQVVRGVSPELDAEALRVVRKARFEPGTQRGEPVKVRLTIPIQYRLGSNQSDR